MTVASDIDSEFARPRAALATGETAAQAQCDELVRRLFPIRQPHSALDAKLLLTKWHKQRNIDAIELYRPGA